MNIQKKRLFNLCLLLVSVIFVYSQNDKQKWVLENYVKKEYMVPMRDGMSLFTVVYRPKDTTIDRAILLNRTPYSCHPYLEGDISSELWDYLYPYMRKGYIYVKQDVRGRFMSEGNYENIRPFVANKKGVEIDEASDSYDTADWLVKNITGNNGRIGVFGISYPGFYALMAGAANHPAIKAVSPQAPVFNWFVGDDFHHHGAFFLKDAFSFMDVFDQVREKQTTEWPSPSVDYQESDYDFFRNKTLKELTEEYFGNTRPFWNDMMNHPDYDAWWQARGAFNACGNIKPAVLVVGGLFDAEDCYGAWKAYESIKQQSPSTDCRLVFGPWYHGGWNRCAGDSLGKVRFDSQTALYYRQHIEQPFFDYYLNGEGNLDSLKEATVFFTGENRWKNFDSWPINKVQKKNLYLSDNQTLSFVLPGSEAQFSQYVSDPSNPVPYDENMGNTRTPEYMINDQRFVDGRTDVLTFTSPVLDQEVSVAGTIQVNLDVSISTTDADFVVKVIDVFPPNFRYADRPQVDMGGYQMLVRGDVFRGRYRKSYSHPEAFVPGEITPVEFPMPDLAHTFKKGHRIMVQIQSSWFPLVDMNPQKFVDIYKCSLADFVKSTVKVYHDANHPSQIVLPVVQ